MRQFHRFKEQHPDCVLFFRMGDFYEMFHDDAKLAHNVLGVALTQRTEGIPMAGVPYHAVDGYLRRMIRAGHRVAVCDQVEDAKVAKGVVKRDVTRIVTPGTLTDEGLLDEAKDNPLAAIAFGRNDCVSLAWVELSTGTFRLGTFEPNELSDEAARIGPSELLYAVSDNGQIPPAAQTLIDQLECAAVTRPGWQFGQKQAVEILQSQCQVKTLIGFGLEDDNPALGPAAAIIHYLHETQRAEDGSQIDRIPHLQAPKQFRRVDHMVVDHISLQSLEVERTIRTGSTEGSLLGVLQDCRTAMGKRLLRHWLCYPLSQRKPIEKRQQVVRCLVDNSQCRNALRRELDTIQDIPRMVSRIAVGRASPRDLVALGYSAAQASSLAQVIQAQGHFDEYEHQLVDVSQPLTELGNQIGNMCISAAPAHLREGGLIRDGVDTPLDEYRALQHDSHTWLANYQKELVDQTGISKLKVGYNKVFGFYIELSSANQDRAPVEWTRKQTLKNAERFITPPLKEYEGKVLTAEQKAISREQELFTQLSDMAQDYLPQLYLFAQLVAELDVLACFASTASRRHYVQPQMADKPVLSLKDARHPVLDTVLTDRFVPNDLIFGSEPLRSDPTLALITGPNMAGKSTYIRQTALIVLMAHTGSFVPATEATIGLCDRIFTRVGASDELHAGQSTFMVEMTETANICHHATPASLVILDEIGRGTSTLDGLSLAWAIAEYLASRGCRTLFATHYHELTSLDEQFDNVTNLHVTVREWKDEIVFLYRIVPGAADQSYGIHVAKIAGIPDGVTDRADELLAQLAISHKTPTASSHTKPSVKKEDNQLSLFTQYLDHPVIDKLRCLELEQISPLEAFDTLVKLRQSLTEDTS